jgi:hypothetical protein
MRAPFLRKIALRGAIVEAHVGRVADPRLGVRVADEDDLPALPEQGPELFFLRTSQGGKEQDRGGQERRDSHAAYSPA